VLRIPPVDVRGAAAKEAVNAEDPEEPVVAEARAFIKPEGTPGVGLPHQSVGSQVLFYFFSSHVTPVFIGRHRPMAKGGSASALFGPRSDPPGGGMDVLSKALVVPEVVEVVPRDPLNPSSCNVHPGDGSKLWNVYA